MSTGARRKIIKNAIHCLACETTIISVNHNVVVKCNCEEANAISITGGNLFFSLDAPYGSAYTVLYEFGELSDACC